jgi:hypothetical protein
MNKIKFVSIWLFVLLLGFYSCKKDLNKISTSDWKPELAAPFFNSTIVLNDLFLDDSNLVTQDDSTLIYFYHQDSVFNISADTVLNINQEDVYKELSFSLGELYMEQFGFEVGLNMEAVLPYLDQNIQDTLLKYDGTQHYFPPFQLNEATSIESEAIENFIQLTFSQGKMYVKISNSLPVNLSNINFQVIDQNNEYVIKQFNIDELNIGQQKTDSVDISGLSLGNKFVFVINSFGSLGSYPNKVMIDLQQGMEFGLQAQKLSVINGQARIMEQIMFSDLSMLDFQLDPEELHHINFASGKFIYTLKSELNLGIDVNLKFPSAKINNETPSQQFMLNAGGTINQMWDISNMNTDLTTDDEQAFNRLPMSLDILILPTDYIVEFDSSDKVFGNFNLEELKLNYADGYLGQQTIDISKDTFDLDFDFLKRIKGELILEEPSINLNYINSIGVPFRIATEFFGINTETGDSQYLDFDSVDMALPLSPGEIVDGQILIDKNNSSIVDFLAIRPNKIIYYGGGISNPDGRELNFVNYNSKLIGNAELKIPLVLRANHLSFSDTLSFNVDSENFPVSDGQMQLNILNGLPFELTMSLVLTDSITGNILDKITFENIASANVDELGKVIEKIPSEIIVDFDKNFLENMKISNRALLNVETSTFGGGTIPVVLFSDYEIEISIGIKAKIIP